MTPTRLIPLFALAAALSAQAADIQRWHTPQGTQVLLAERHELPMVDYAVIFKGAGSTADPAGKSDTAAFTAGMIMRGTQDLDENAFNERISDLGAHVSGSSSLEYSVFGLRSLSSSDILNRSATLFARALSAPKFDAAVLQRLQNQSVAALNQAQSYPDYLTAVEQTKLNYPDHPYGNPARRSEAGIRAVTVADLHAFRQNRYAQNQAIAVIVGDIDRQGAERLVRATVGRLPETASGRSTIPPVKISGGKISRLPFSGSQANISIGLPVLTDNDPDYFPLLVGNYILGGGGFDSRLMKVLRDRHGYTYGARSSFAAYEQAGPFNISFATERKNSRAALAAARKVLEDFVAQGPDEDELRQAKANITGGFVLNFDSNGKLLDVLTDIGLHNRPTDWLDTYNDKINAVTAADIRRAFQNRIKSDRMNTVITGGAE